jgi:hypothetical protein
MGTAVKYSRMAILLAAAASISNVRAAVPTAAIDTSTLNTLWSFNGPQNSLAQPTLHGGALYSVTYSPDAVTGFGSVVEFKPPAKKGGAWKEVEIYAFLGGADGYNPNPGLVFDSNGALYGTTNDYGGESCGADSCGNVYQLTLPRALAGLGRIT